MLFLSFFFFISCVFFLPFFNFVFQFPFLCLPPDPCLDTSHCRCFFSLLYILIQCSYVSSENL
jgi:hypothetical protein